MSFISGSSNRSFIKSTNLNDSRNSIKNSQDMDFSTSTLISDIEEEEYEEPIFNTTLSLKKTIAD